MKKRWLLSTGTAKATPQLGIYDLIQPTTFPLVQPSD